MLELITAVSAVRLYIPSDLRPLDNRMSVLKAIQVIKKFSRMAGGAGWLK